MKKSEKTELTREKILQAAISEFGKKGYAGASLNTICNGNGISKGLIYHNFQGKDEIYLSCVAQCMEIFLDFMKTQDIKNDIKKYMDMRYQFLANEPLLSRIFFEAVLQPPPHLCLEIEEIKKELNEFNLNLCRQAIKSMTLRDGVAEEEAIEYFTIVQEMYNGYFNGLANAGNAFPALVIDHEKKLKKILDFMLYGIVKEE